MKIEGMTALVATLGKLKEKGKSVSVIVGYTQAYAIHVHENLEALHGAAWNQAYIVEKMGVDKHGNKKVARGWSTAAVKMGYHLNKAGNAKNPVPKNPNQQAKFLEQPARVFAQEIAEIIRTAVRRGSSMLQALLLGGLFLQRKSQEIVPIDIGALRASAFTRAET